ncbi:phosphoribosyltransferase [Amycolatopsis sp. NPDC049691]|uniref:phosphoribosyltransferase n=1 Tax=Amycolatopsis sp. NPDC049691 TaxID=3155155 RepID=UPI00343861A4
MALILDLFLHYNLALLEDVTEGFDCVVTVPSTRPEPSDSLQKIIEGTDSFSAPYIQPLRRGRVDLGSRVMSDEGFSVHGDIHGRRVLLLDDVYTTGSRAQSAASALALAGATVVAILVLARRINPEFNEASARVWQRQEKMRFTFPRAMDWLID